MATVRTGVLWTGGKDSVAALLLAAGGVPVDPGRFVLVTLAPPRARFRCHPLWALREQAAALGLGHLVPTVEEADWRAGYRAAFRTLRERHGVTHLVCGDHAPEAWLAADAARSGLGLDAPLTRLARREEVFGVLAGHRAVPSVSGVRAEHYRPGLLGRRLSPDALPPGIDPCGEHGEYHTLVTELAGRPLLDRDLATLPHVLADGIWALGAPAPA